MDDIKFWCQKCLKKYTLDTRMLTKVERSFVQKKPPFIDHEENNKKTDSQIEERKPIYKCPICGFTLKEIDKDE